MLRAPAALLLTSLLAACAMPGPAVEHVADPSALGPYSAAVRAENIVFVAGKIGRDRESFATEVESAITAVETQLAELGLSLADVVSVNVFVTDIDRYAEVNEIYAKRFPAPYPARTFVAVRALPGGAAIEIQAVAYRSGG